MTALNNGILAVDDSGVFNDTIRDLLASEFPQFEVCFARSIDEAYWKYLENPPFYKLVLFDFNLEGNRSKSNFDGIDLALIIDTFAIKLGHPTPWLVALTTASDELLACFWNVTTKAPLMAVIRKGKGAKHLTESLRSLMKAMADDNPTEFTGDQQKTATPLKLVIESDLGRNTLTTNISRKLFASYRFVKFTRLAPGYSGSEVLSVTARRTSDSSEARTFVVKLCKANTEASRKLEDEFNNYLKHAPVIKAYVPLLIGPFEIKGWRFVAYEFVSFLGEGIRTFADYLQAIHRENIRPVDYEQESYIHSNFIFDTILKEWHQLRDAASPPPDSHSLYEHTWFKKVLESTRKKITSLFTDLKPALRKNDRRLPVTTFINRPETTQLANPFYVVNRLLSMTGIYAQHSLANGLVHGDLHSGNILRSLTLSTGDPAEWKLIDFANMYEGSHLAQDAGRLECDIKFQQIASIDLHHRVVLEIELGTRLNPGLRTRLGKTLDLDYWSAQWDEAPNEFRLVERQIADIRKITLARLKLSENRDVYSPHMDYAVSLLMQSLMFVRYGRQPIITMHAWFAACMTATVIDEYFVSKKEELTLKDTLGTAAVPINR